MKALTGKRAWQAIITVIVVHELTCQDGELLSEETDRQRANHPVLIPAAITITALHLLRLLPPEVDPFIWADHALKGNQHLWPSIPTNLIRSLPSLSLTKRRLRRLKRQHLLHRLSHPASA